MGGLSKTGGRLGIWVEHYLERTEGLDKEEGIGDK